MKISRFNEFKDMSDELKYHIENNIPFTKNIFREGSDAFYKLLKEVRELYENNQIELKGIDKELYENTDIGKFEKIDGRIIPLDIPMLDENLSPQVTSDSIFSIHDKKSGDIIKVEGEDVVLIEPKEWIKNKEANCIRFTGMLNSQPVQVKYDDGYDSYIFESLYKGKKVDLNKPKRNTGSGKKYYVYVKDPKTGNIKKVTFGDAKGGLTSKVNDPKARKSFVARHKCNRKWKPEDKLSAAYWSCRLPKFKNLVNTTYSGYW